MLRNKSPGVDGLPAEFYVRFWNLLGPDLVQVYNSSFSHGMLPGFSALLAIIRHHIWVIRNASWFDGSDPVLALSMERIKSSFRFCYAYSNAIASLHAFSATG